MLCSQIKPHQPFVTQWFRGGNLNASDITYIDGSASVF